MQPSTLNPKPQTLNLNSQPTTSTLNPELSNLNPQSSTLNLNPQTLKLNPEPSTLNPKSQARRAQDYQRNMRLARQRAIASERGRAGPASERGVPLSFRSEAFCWQCAPDGQKSHPVLATLERASVCVCVCVSVCV